MNDMDAFLPMARKERLVTEELPGELLIYDLDRDRAHRLNLAARLVWEHCDGRTSVAAMTALLQSELGTPQVAELVALTVRDLQARHLVEGVAPRRSGLSRRELMRRVGIAAAISVPVVVSLQAPLAAQAVSCFPDGAACTVNTDCCSANCNAGICGPALARADTDRNGR